LLVRQFGELELENDWPFVIQLQVHQMIVNKLSRDRSAGSTKVC